MKISFPFAVVSPVLVLLALFSARAEENCAPVGKAQFMCLPHGTEDMVPLPNSDWVVGSGVLTLINTRTFATAPLFSTNTRHDKRVYGACPGPLTADDVKDRRFHVGGLNVSAGSDGVHRLYALHRGSRSSVEVFEVDTGPAIPTIAWIGCTVIPPDVGGNSMAVLPDEGVVVSNFVGRNMSNITAGGGADARTLLAEGKNTGELWEWHRTRGWGKVPGSEASGPNGVEASKDGKWLYFSEWATSRVVRLSRGQTPVRRESVQLSFHPDNIRWQRDGSLLTAGQGGTVNRILLDCLSKSRDCSKVPTVVARIHPEKFTAQEVVRYELKDGAGAAALDTGKELWVTIIGGTNRIARFSAY